MNIVNKITMEYLAERNYHNDKEESQDERYSLNDLKFYRKRIVNLVKERIVKKTQSKGKNLDELDKILDRFYELCINKFKIEDYHDIKQAELQVFNEKLNSDLSLDDIEDKTIYKDLDDCNQLLFSSHEEKKITLDNFVIKSDGTLTKTPTQYPQLNKINLRDKKLKYKGLTREKSK